MFWESRFHSNQLPCAAWHFLTDDELWRSEVKEIADEINEDENETFSTAVCPVTYASNPILANAVDMETINRNVRFANFDNRKLALPMTAYVRIKEMEFLAIHNLFQQNVEKPTIGRVEGCATIKPCASSLLLCSLPLSVPSFLVCCVFPPNLLSEKEWLILQKFLSTQKKKNNCQFTDLLQIKNGQQCVFSDTTVRPGHVNSRTDLHSSDANVSLGNYTKEDSEFEKPEACSPGVHLSPDLAPQAYQFEDEKQINVSSRCFSGLPELQDSYPRLPNSACETNTVCSILDINCYNEGTSCTCDSCGTAPLYTLNSCNPDAAANACNSC